MKPKREPVELPTFAGVALANHCETCHGTGYDVESSTQYDLPCMVCSGQGMQDSDEGVVLLNFVADRLKTQIISRPR